MVQSPARLRIRDARRRYAGYFRAHGDLAPLRDHRIAARSMGARALRAWPQGPHGDRCAARRRSARPGFALELDSEPARRFARCDIVALAAQNPYQVRPENAAGYSAVW